MHATICRSADKGGNTNAEVTINCVSSKDIQVDVEDNQGGVVVTFTKDDLVFMLEKIREEEVADRFEKLREEEEAEEHELYINSLPG